MAKETIDQNHTNPLYTVEAVEFNEKSPAAQWVDASASADGVDLTSIRSAGDAQSLAQRVQDFNTATVSKVVDPDTGKPLVMYHGTSGNEGGDAFTYFDAYASNYGLAAQIWLAIPARNCGALAGLQKQSYMDALALLAVSPSSRCCGVPPGLGIALLDRGQLQHLRTCLLH